MNLLFASWLQTTVIVSWHFIPYKPKFLIYFSFHCIVQRNSFFINGLLSSWRSILLIVWLKNLAANLPTRAVKILSNFLLNQTLYVCYPRASKASQKWYHKNKFIKFVIIPFSVSWNQFSTHCVIFLLTFIPFKTIVRKKMVYFRIDTILYIY